MAQIKNNHNAELTVGRYAIAPGAVVEIPDWDIVKNGDVEFALLAGGFISEVVEEKKSKKDDK